MLSDNNPWQILFEYKELHFEFDKKMTNKKF